MILINQDSSDLYSKINETNLLLVKTSFVLYKFISFIFERFQLFYILKKYIYLIVLYYILT